MPSVLPRLIRKAAARRGLHRTLIKAEMVSYDEFIACGGTKTAGKLRLEGKEYVVQDSDIVNFRFNV